MIASNHSGFTFCLRFNMQRLFSRTVFYDHSVRQPQGTHLSFLKDFWSQLLQLYSCKLTVCLLLSTCVFSNTLYLWNDHKLLGIISCFPYSFMMVFCLYSGLKIKFFLHNRVLLTGNHKKINSWSQESVQMSADLTAKQV